MADSAVQAKDIMIMNDKDNVGVCLRDFRLGDTVSIIKGNTDTKLKLSDEIPRGHKVAILDIKTGETIIKYGEVIGKAAEDIAAGKHVHVHNVVD